MHTIDAEDQVALLQASLRGDAVRVQGTNASTHGDLLLLGERDPIRCSCDSLWSLRPSGGPNAAISDSESSSTCFTGTVFEVFLRASAGGLLFCVSSNSYYMEL